MESNIEAWCAIMVKVIISVYIFRKLWHYITNKDLIIWKLLTPKKKSDKKPQKVVATTGENITSDSEVIGNTQKVFIERIPKTLASPAVNESQNEETEAELEPEITGIVPLEYPTPEPEIDITEDDVEVVIVTSSSDKEEFIISEHEQATEDDDFSTGMTFDQLKGAVDVLANLETANVEEQEEAAKVLYEVKNTDMFEFIASQVSNVATIDKLFSDFFDGNGLPKKNRSDKFSIEGFDISEFI